MGPRLCTGSHAPQDSPAVAHGQSPGTYTDTNQKTL